MGLGSKFVRKCEVNSDDLYSYQIDKRITWHLQWNVDLTIMVRYKGKAKEARKYLMSLCTEMHPKVITLHVIILNHRLKR